MSRLSRYLLRNLLIASVFITVALTVAVWMTQALRLIDLVVDGGAPLTVFARLAALTLPTFLSLVLPIALFVATVFTYHRLTLDSELVVMRAAGLSPAQLARPVFGLCALMTVGVFALTIHVAPAAWRELAALQHLVRNSVASIVLREGVFNTLDDGLTVFVRERTPDGDLLGLVLHDSRDPAAPVTIIAERGVLAEGDAGSRVVVFNGVRQEAEADGARLSQLFFERYAVDLSVFEAEFGSRSMDAREQTLAELLAADERGDTPEARVRSELHQRFAMPFLTLAFPLVGVASLLSGNFNRRGQAGRIFTATLIVVCIQGLTLTLVNAVARRPELVPLLYMTVTLPIAGALIGLRRTGLARRPAAPAPA